MFHRHSISLGGFQMRTWGFISAALLLAFLPAVWSQTSTSVVRGTVRDQSDASVPGAEVSLTNIETNIAFRTVTNGVGFYIFPGVQPGLYRLKVEAKGMEKYEANQ